MCAVLHRARPFGFRKRTIIRIPQFLSVLLLILRGIAPTVLAAPAYQIDVWRAEDGLPQSTVTSVVQTPDGYLWLGTQNGLVRFDGVSFKVFNQNNTAPLKNNRIVQLHVDRRGTLWIGAEEGNLVRYQDDQFTSYAMPGIGSPFNYAREMCDDAAGNLWVLTCEWRLLRLENGNFTVPSLNWNLDGPRATAVASDHNGQIYAGTDTELAIGRDGVFTRSWGQADETNYMTEFLATARSGGCWVAGNGRLRRFESGRWVADLGTYHWTNHTVYGLYVYGLCEDSRGCVWVATLGSGLFRYDPDGTTVHITSKDGLPTDFVRCVTEDREGNIWAGMEGGGLCRLKPLTFQALGVREGLSSDQVMSICEAADDSFWIGMNGSGVDHLIGGQVEHYGPSEGLANGHVWSLIQDHHQTIWAGTWGGLFKLEDGRFMIQTNGGVGAVPLALYEDRKQGIWIGQQAVGDLIRLNGDEVKTLNLPGAASGLDVRVMMEDHEDRLWIGTENQGLYRWDKSELLHLGIQDGLRSDSIWSLRADADGTMWIGTCGGGLSRWRDGKIKTWTTRDGLINDVICQILEDRRGNLWLGSYGGVFRVSKAALNAAASDSDQVLHCVSYGRADGLPSTECRGGFQPSGCESRDGRLWFPTIKGFAVLDPERIPSNSVPPIVILERLLVDGVDQTDALAKARAEAELAHPPPRLKIPPGKVTVEFHYTATSLTAPDKVLFKYWLAGLEQGWVTAGTKRSVAYSRLPPGEYNFRVIACNNDGLWNEVGATLALVVLPHFWQTSWFMVLTTLFSLASAAGIANYVAHRRMHHRLELVERERAIEQERTRIAQDMHDDLGAHLTEIALLSEFAQNPDSDPESVQTDIRKITTKARALTASLDEIVWAVEPENDSLESFVTYACSFAEHHLATARISCRLEVPAQLPPAVLRTEVRHNLFLAFKETVNNAVKHSQAREVRISIACDHSRFAVKIRDNGKGFVMDSGTGKSTMDDAGMQQSGLTNIRKRMSNIHGICEIQTQPGAGVEVTLSLPMPGK